MTMLLTLYRTLTTQPTASRNDGGLIDQLCRAFNRLFSCDV